MYWSDSIAKQIVASGKYKPYLVDDMFTPSGYAHIGALRGPIVHDLAYKSLKKLDPNTKFTFMINDFDPIDGLPDALEKDFKKYLGVPLRNVPSPEKGYSSFADYFAADYLNTMKAFGVEPEVKSTFDAYQKGLFNGVIKEALDNAEEIAEIYHEVSGSKKRDLEWFPLQVICPNCGKVGTTRVYGWDGKVVSFKCEVDLVNWAKGCKLEDKISPFDGKGKLPWKVDWPAHWKVFNITIEGAGKDHSVAGGSRDIAREICKRVFHIEEPFNLPYEFFTLGGKKMSASKGLGLQARDLVNLLPDSVGRFLFCRTNYQQEIDFNPIGTMAIPDLFDEYDRCWQSFINNPNEDLSRTFEVSQIGKVPKHKKIFLPRFRDVANYLQTGISHLTPKFEQVKGSKLSEEEEGILKEREKYAKIWLGKYAPPDFYVGMSENLPERVKELDGKQREFLSKAIDLIEQAPTSDELQVNLYNLAKDLRISTKNAFTSIYITMNGKNHGPKAGVFLLQYPKDKVIQRLKEAVNYI